MKETTPLVSLILPVRNESAYIERCLNAIFAQNYPADRLEIIIADGMSTDGTRDYLNEWIVRHPKIRILDNPEKIVPTALNRAIREVKGDIIIRVDGHCEIAADYVVKCVHHLHQKPVDAVGGPIETIGETWLSQAIALAMSTKFGVGNSAFRTEMDQEKLVDTVAFPAYTREAIQSTGFFDEELVRNQDDEYNYRLRKNGGKILLSPEVKSRYFSRSSLGSLWKQYFQYGYWKVRVLQKHPKQMSLRQFVPPIFVLSVLLPFSLSIVFPVIVYAGWVILGIYFLANIAMSLITVVQHKWSHIIVLPWIYAILHFAYGSGFLFGLVKFSDRWNDKKGLEPENLQI